MAKRNVSRGVSIVEKFHFSNQLETKIKPFSIKKLMKISILKILQDRARARSLLPIPFSTPIC